MLLLSDISLSRLLRGQGKLANQPPGLSLVAGWDEVMLSRLRLNAATLLREERLVLEGRTDIVRRRSRSILGLGGFDDESVDARIPQSMLFIPASMPSVTDSAGDGVMSSSVLLSLLVAIGGPSGPRTDPRVCVFPILSDSFTTAPPGVIVTAVVAIAFVGLVLSAKTPRPPTSFEVLCLSTLDGLDTCELDDRRVSAPVTFPRGSFAVSFAVMATPASGELVCDPFDPGAICNERGRWCGEGRGEFRGDSRKGAGGVRFGTGRSGAGSVLGKCPDVAAGVVAAAATVGRDFVGEEATGICFSFGGESLLGIFEAGGTSPGSAGGDGSESLLACASSLERPEGPARELVPVTLRGRAGAAVMPSAMSGSLVLMWVGGGRNGGGERERVVVRVREDPFFNVSWGKGVRRDEGLGGPVLERCFPRTVGEFVVQSSTSSI